MKKIEQELLIELYINQKLSLQQIADKFNCSGATVLNWMKRYGIPRRTVSDSLKGRANTWARLHRHKWVGKTVSEETKQKLSISRKGKSSWNKGLTKRTDDRLKNTGKSKELHWNWKGGLSNENILLRQSDQYKTWRTLVFQRDQYYCRMCGITHCELEAHHIKPFSTNMDERFNIDNGLTLCKQCHKLLHKQEKENGKAQQKTS